MDPVVASGGKRSQIAKPKAKTDAVRCGGLPETFQGKEGVDGSSPSEGSAKVQHVAAFAFSPTCNVGGYGAVMELSRFRTASRGSRPGRPERLTRALLIPRSQVRFPARPIYERPAKRRLVSPESGDDRAEVSTEVIHQLRARRRRRDRRHSPHLHDRSRVRPSSAEPALTATALPGSRTGPGSPARVPRGSELRRPSRSTAPSIGTWGSPLRRGRHRASTGSAAV